MFEGFLLDYEMKNYIISTLFLGFGYSTIINIPSDYSTIQEAVENSSALDKIFIKNGTYSGTIYLNSKSLTIVGESLAGVNITFNSSPNQTMPNSSFLYLESSILDISNIKSLGWNPKTSLEDGVNKVYQWYIKQ